MKRDWEEARLIAALVLCALGQAAVTVWMLFGH
jgi:hypothetical protein